MAELIPIKYRNRNYPEGISAKIEEMPAHFDREKFSPRMDYSMHTEPSLKKRNSLKYR